MWTDGYNNTFSYTQGYYEETNPHCFEPTLLIKGFETRRLTRALELGAGMFTTSIVNASCNDIEWWAIDFMPDHVSNGLKVARDANLPINILEMSFEELAKDSSLPKFDYIYLHGIWSWVTEENRSYIIEILKNKLNTDGVVFASYNVLPGWSPFLPVRELMFRHYRLTESDFKSPENRIFDSINFALNALNSAPPSALRDGNINRLRKLQAMAPSYLAHEFFNEAWRVTTILDVAQSFSQSKLSFACTSNLNEVIDSINFSKETLAFISDIQDPVLSEYIKDISVSIQFRKDFWMKARKKIDVKERIQQLSHRNFISFKIKESDLYKMHGYLGNADLHKDFYEPIFLQAEKLQSGSLKEIFEFLDKREIEQDKQLEVLATLLVSGLIKISLDEFTLNAVKGNIQKFNKYVLGNCFSKTPIDYLISPVTGRAFNANVVDKYCITKELQGSKPSYQEFSAEMHSRGLKIEMSSESPSDGDKSVEGKFFEFEEKISNIQKLGIL